MATHSLSSESEGLTKIFVYIESLSPQCPHDFRSDENNIRFLRSAVIDHEWALAHIRRIVTHHYKFTAFLTALNESLQISQERMIVQVTSISTRFSNIRENEAVEVFFQRYMRHHRDVRKQSSLKSSMNRSGFIRNYSRGGFNRNINCGSFKPKSVESNSRTFEEA